MRKDIAIKWADKLRTTHYEQGIVYLSRCGKYDALGILCLVAQDEGIGWFRGSTLYDSPTYFDEAYRNLPQSVMKWAEIKTADAWIDDKHSIGAANDRGVSFPEIADMVMDNYENI